MGWSGLFVVVCCVVGVVKSQNTCITPNGETAQCISIYKCNVFINALANRTSSTVRFMRESRCGYMEDPLVCCGSVAQYSSISSPTPTPTPKPITTYALPLDHPNVALLPNNKSCGIQSVTNRIFGGNETSFGEYPWMALLEYRRNGKSLGHSCGATLISERYVVTAAHCIVGKIQIEVGDVFRVRFGEHNLDTVKDCDSVTDDPICADPVVDIDIEDYMVHPQYDDNSRNKFHDIAIVRLKTPVKFTEYIRPICLPLKKEATPVGRNATIAGWGFTERGVFSSTLVKAEIPIAATSDCVPVYERLGTDISNGQVCAGGKKGVDSCSGDSGGPLMGKYSKSDGILRGRIYLEGIVSYGTSQCGQESVPGIYTKVGEYMQWILDNLKP